MVMYNMEKILYLASQPKRLHVAPREKKMRSTLWGLLTQAKENNWLTQCATDDSGAYYELTPDGEARLRTLQAAWQLRNRRGESC